MRFGLGHNATTLTPFVPQPRFEGILYGRTVFTPAGVIQDAPYAELIFPALTPAEMATLMSALDLVSNSSRAITVGLPGDDRVTYQNWNGYAVRPTAQYSNPLHRDVLVLVTAMVKI